jgi:NAD(P)-dependent dehydrogenase (short-subunit alcohol dehydrogenase family)
MDLGIKGKVALVVGCSRGMGYAVAKELTEAGCKVVGVSRNAGDYRFDITDQPRLNDFIDAMHREHGAPDIIVHVTGGSAGLRDHMQPWSAWEKVLQLNLGAAHEINRAFLPIMVSRGWGRIVHFSSNGVKLGTGRAPYIAAKHAVEGYVQIMAREFGKQGVIFSVVRPGPIFTPGIFIYEQDEAWTKAFMEKYVPMGRWGKDEEVAAAVAFMCSARASYMPGAIVDVCGGMR